MRFVLGLATLALAGCSTTPQSIGESNPVQSAAYATPGPGLGTLVVKRDGGGYGSACGFQISVNARNVAALRSGDYVTVYMPPGEVIVGAQMTGVICGSVLVETPTTLQAGKTNVLRIGIDSAGVVRLAPTAR